MAHDTIPRRLLSQAEIRPEAIAYAEKRGGAWVTTNWRTYVDEILRAARALGLEPGGTACILGFNRPEWAIMDFATMVAGGAPAGIYTTSSPDEIKYILSHAEARVVLVEDDAQRRKVESVRAELPHLRHVVVMRGAEASRGALSWEDFLDAGAAVDVEEIRRRVDALEPSGLATLIYTSGTTGPPKAVMLSHENLAWTARVAQELAGGSSRDVCLSYLPLSHIAEQMFTLHGPATMGAAVHFAESIEKVADNLREVRPTLFFGVPRIWEKFFAGMSKKLEAAPRAKKLLAAWAQRVGREAASFEHRGEALPLRVAAAHAVAHRLVFSKVKAAVGLDRARFLVSGAAPISKEILEFLSGLDLTVLEVYGQSEGTGPTTFNARGRTKLGSVGPAIPGAEVRLAEDGEILLRGKNVFLGYLKDEAATTETLVDGWLCSGDLGSFDDEGFLFITGRKKEILITAGGKNIAPKNIESALKNHALVGEVVVIGDRRKYLTALVSLDPEASLAWATARGKDPSRLHDDAELRGELAKAIDEVNQTLARVETVKKFSVTRRPFSIDRGELTPTLKVKRKKVYEHFAAEIEAMYAGDDER